MEKSEEINIDKNISHNPNKRKTDIIPINKLHSIVMISKKNCYFLKMKF